MTRILIADDHDVCAIRIAARSWKRIPVGKLFAEPPMARRHQKGIGDKAGCCRDRLFAPALEWNRSDTADFRKREPRTEVLIFTMHDEEILIRNVLEAGALGYLLKADAKRYVVAAVEALAEHKPFFTARVSQTLLASFLGKRGAASDQILFPPRGVRYQAHR